LVRREQPRIKINNLIFYQRREQGTGNREQGTGNREQGTGNREQGTGNSFSYFLFGELGVIKSDFYKWSV
jgi:hypothetical protein